MIERDYKATGQCRMMLAKIDFERKYLGFVLPKESRLKPIIDQKYLRNKFKQYETAVIYIVDLFQIVTTDRKWRN